MANPSPNFRIGTGKLVFLCLLFLFVYALALIVFMPAGWAWRWVAQDLQLPPGLVVSQLDGTLWDGQALLHYQQLPIRLNWEMRSGGLLSGRLPVDWEAGAGKSHLRGRVVVSASKKMAINVSGRLHMADFSRWVREQGGAQLAGDVAIRRLSLIMTDTGWQNANGLAQWAGGLVTWPMGGSQQQATMPPMQAVLKQQQGVLDLTVSKTGSSQPAARLTLATTGVMRLMVYRRLLDLAGQSWPQSVPPGATVFSMRQRVLPPLRGEGL